MQIKRFETANLQEATAKIRRELGADAIILSTKKISAHPPLIEVLAARDDRSARAVSSGTLYTVKQERQNDALSCIMGEISGLKSSIDELKKSYSFPYNQIDIKQTLDALLDHASSGNPTPLDLLYKRLITNGLSRAKSFELIETIKNNFPREETDTVEKGLLIAGNLISRSLRKDQHPGKRVKALIGPTGVGKTTTIAKLAAHYSLDKKMKVGLISTDTYRIAASEQLKVYATIMGLPVHIASDREGFLRSLTDFSDKDIVLVDTPGRNHRDERGLNHEKTIFNEDVETLLLLSPAATREYLSEMASHLQILNYSRIILTKVDECRHFGPLYDVLEEIAKPVCYMTTGQIVPSDIEKTSPERLSQLILHNRLN